jgi:hypothetical protein
MTRSLTPMRNPLTWLTALAAAAMSAVLALPTAAAADTWNERTLLSFSAPIMIPGATLQPGTYTFKLADVRSGSHTVQIFKGDGGELVTIAHAVPVRRERPAGDTILTFNPTERGIPALKAWYYPHSAYGHEFIYSDEEAKQIAERSKTIVLSGDVAHSDRSGGTLRLYHPEGTRSEWRADTQTEREWGDCRRERAARGASATDGRSASSARAHAPMMMTRTTAMRVTLDDIESNPAKFIGQTISVDAEVEEVFGPRLFSIDEPHWGDLDGEVLVYAPSILAALVKDDDRLTITGTLTMVAMADIEREWGWFKLDPEIEVDFLKKPVLVADRIVGGDNNVAMLINVSGAPSTASAGSGGTAKDVSRFPAAGDRVIMDPATVGGGSSDLVGRHVDLKNVRVLRMADTHGFFIDVPGGAVLVLPATGAPVTVKPGDTVSVRGAIADAPRRTAERTNPPSDWNPHIYVVAVDVTTR